MSLKNNNNQILKRILAGVGVNNPSSRKTRATRVAAGAGREPGIDIVHVEGKKGERLIEKAGQAVKIRA